MTDQTPDGGTPWCCTGLGFVSACPLCPQYGTSLLDYCPGHEASEENQTRVVEARLHAQRRHPGYTYTTTRGPRKQWDDPDQPPADDNGDPDPTWEPNVDAGRPGMGWDRFEYHEEAYWRRRKTPPEAADARHSGPHTPDRQPDASDGENAAQTGAQGFDPRQPAYDAVYAYIRSTNRMPGDLAYRNAMIWRAVTAALDAAGVPAGRNEKTPAIRQLAAELLDRGRDYANRSDRNIGSAESQTKAHAIVDASRRFAEAAGLPADSDFGQIRDAAIEMANPPEEQP